MIIGVSGKARSGKGVFAEVAEMEYGFKKISFAGALKKEVESFLQEHNVPYEKRNLYGENADKEETFIVPETDLIPVHGLCEKYATFKDLERRVSFRSLLQWWGTEFRRSQSVNYWVDQALAQCTQEIISVETMMGPIPVESSRYVIDDMRFENEADALLEVDATLVRIDRPNNPFPVSNPDHPSETSLDNWMLWHWIIENDCTLEDYKQGCRVVLEEVCYGPKD